MQQAGIPADEVQLLVEIMQHCVDLALLQFHHRQPDRVAESRVIQVFSILGAIQRMNTRRGRTLREALLEVTGLEGAVDLIARTVAYTHRMVRHQTRLPEDRVSPRASRLLWDFLMLIRSGVLVSQGVPCESLITQRMLFQRMMQLQAEDPEQYAARETCLQHSRETKLTAVDVEKLYKACQSHRDTAILALLAESAFRARAVSTARLFRQLTPCLLCDPPA